MKVYIVVSHEDSYITAEKAFYTKKEANNFAIKYANEHWINVEVLECDLK